MSDQKIEALEIGLYEDYLEELKKILWIINKVLGEPWFLKLMLRWKQRQKKSKRIYGSQFINNQARVSLKKKKKKSLVHKLLEK